MKKISNTSLTSFYNGTRLFLSVIMCIMPVMPSMTSASHAFMYGRAGRIPLADTGRSVYVPAKIVMKKTPGAADQHLKELAQDFLDQLSFISSVGNPSEEEIRIFLSSFEEFMNCLYYDASFVSLHNLLYDIRVAVREQNFDRAVELQERLMALQGLLSDKNFRKYHMAIADDIRRFGLYGIENIALKLMDYELLNDRHEIMNAVRDNMDGIEAHDLPVIIHDTGDYTFLALDASYRSRIFKGMLALDARGGDNIRGLRDILNMISCSEAASALYLSGELELPQNAALLPGSQINPAGTGNTGIPSADIMIGAACGSGGSRNELTDMADTHSGGIDPAALGGTCDYVSNLGIAVAEASQDTLDTYFETVDCADVMIEAAIGMQIFGSGVDIPQGENLEGSHRSWLSDVPDGQSGNSDNSQSSENDDENSNSSQPEDADNAESADENVSNAPGVLDYVDFADNAVALALDVAEVGAATAAGLAATVAGVGMFLWTCASDITSAYDDDPNNNWMERHVNKHRERLDSQNNSGNNVQNSEIRSSFDGDPTGEGNGNTVMTRAQCSSMVKDVIQRSNHSGDNIMPLPWDTGDDGTGSDFQEFSGCESNWWAEAMDRRQQLMNPGPDGFRVYGQEAVNFNQDFRSSLCEQIHIAGDGGYSYCGDQNGSDYDGIVPAGDGPQPAPVHRTIIKRHYFTVR